LNEEAQNALLKTLEEPARGVTIVLCADREELLLPTVRSRCARVRLGPTSAREIESLVVELGLADASTAGRLARIAEGRPGIALTYARAPEGGRHPGRDRSVTARPPGDRSRGPTRRDP
jgi:DNA polymerase-3 subunit delta'